MTTILPETTVGQIVAQQPNRSRVFEALGLDYCCGGKKTLADACAKKGLDVNTVLERLSAVEPYGTAAESASHLDMPLPELADLIEATHHAYLNRELPRLKQLLDKVAKVHGEKDARLGQLRDIFAELQAELESHLMKEERVLFPAIRRLCGIDAECACSPATIAAPIRVMEAEHDSAGEALEAIRTLTDGFTPPDWACNTYRATLDGLHELELDMHQHIHKENNILFPRALALERGEG
ncbi:MAG: iron-sulfur cluster repair di-iron protein [Candidatus Hydrogenedentes bacterium]|nr:iron-sulfur cluster repair di-iron protein [Candidatus Hydrogenedentota bacterium]